LAGSVFGNSCDGEKRHFFDAFFELPIFTPSLVTLPLKSEKKIFHRFTIDRFSRKMFRPIESKFIWMRPPPFVGFAGSVCNAVIAKTSHSLRAYRQSVVTASSQILQI